MKGLAITVTAEAAPFLEAIQSLSELPLEVVKRFISSIEAGSQLVRFDLDGSSATRTNDLRVVLKPSEFLLGFMAATGAGDRYGRIRENV